MSMNKAVFLDKDGTLIRNIPYNVNPDLISLMPNAAAGVKLLQDRGYVPIIVSNQSGVALGYFTEADLIGVTAKIRLLLGEEGITVHGFYYCPHFAEGIVQPYAYACNCRKPLPGMLLAAARHFTISLADSWMIGDILDDIEAGKKAGCHTILVNNGNETEWELTETRKPDYMTADLKEAADIILSLETPEENKTLVIGNEHADTRNL